MGVRLDIGPRVQEDIHAFEVVILDGFHQCRRAELVRLADIRALPKQPAQHVAVMALDRVEQGRAAVAPARSSSGPASSPASSPVPVSPAAEAVLATVRARLADDLDAPGAVAAIDGWAEAVLDNMARSGAAPQDAALVRDLADALLGVTL